ncbi:type II secretion system protein, partial [uncultured Fretibacterium sp.]|uniref:PulJ/GspJ family protein n=1 Tax=uncultured Fretibacterium sp. TaxID=1678694 RepID=UPI002616D6C1
MSGARRGFTLMEVLVAVAIVGMVVAAGFRLITMSLRSLSEIAAERELTAAAQRIWLRFRTEKDMPESGKEEGVEWRTEIDSVPVEDLELPFRRVTVSLGKRSMVIYLPEA